MALNPVIIIPARMASTRLPGKPLADIQGLPMIVHVARRGEEAAESIRAWGMCSCPVYVATDSQDIFDAVEAAGHRVVMTASHHQSGTDRIAEALTVIEKETGETFGAVVNVQGDLPTIDPAIIHMALIPIEKAEFDIGTLACEITEKADIANPNIVKPIMSDSVTDALPELYKANDFTREPKKSADGKYYHHIGLYAYTRDALERFVKLPPSNLEQIRRLEQLRALENGMTIGVRVVNTVPLGVDTPEDLEKARIELSQRKETV